MNLEQSIRLQLMDILPETDTLNFLQEKDTKRGYFITHNFVWSLTVHFEKVLQ